MTFTAPAGATHAVLNVYDTVNAAPSDASFNDMWARVMVNTVAVAVDFQPAAPVGTKAYPARVLNAAGPVSVLASGTSVLVRQADWRRPAKAVMRRLNAGVAPTDALSGAVDFAEARFVSSSYGPDLLDVAWNAGAVVWASTDNTPPVKINNMYIGGNHGIAATARMTVAGHGLTNADVGDVGNDGTGKLWVLARVVNADTLVVVAANTGASTAFWTITGALAVSGTMTFAAAGAKSWSARVATQFWPILQNLSQKLNPDDVTEITAQGVFSGHSVSVRESYGIPNPAAWLATLIAEKGTLTPKLPNNPAIATQIHVQQAWRFDRYGAMVGTATHRTEDDFRLIIGSSHDYIG